MIKIINNKNNKRNKYPLVHLNKIGLDNRLENIIEDKLNKEIRKNLNIFTYLWAGQNGLPIFILCKPAYL